MIIETFSPEATADLGNRIAKQLNPGDVVCLTGDLGVGKTVFTQGFAEGLGIDDPICSPTFTIILEYHSGRIPLYHFDVYRISDIYEMDDLGYEEYFYSGDLCLVEWPEKIEALIPDDAMVVRIEVGDDENRIFEIE